MVAFLLFMILCTLLGGPMGFVIGLGASFAFLIFAIICDNMANR